MFGEKRGRGEGGRGAIVGGGEKEGVCLVEGVRAEGGVFPLYSVMPCDDAFLSFPRRGESSQDKYEESVMFSANVISPQAGIQMLFSDFSAS